MVLAVDLGGTKTAIARVGEDGVIVPGTCNAAIGHGWCPNLWGPEEVPLLHALKDKIALEDRNLRVFDEYARRWFQRAPDPAPGTR